MIRRTFLAVACATLPIAPPAAAQLPDAELAVVLTSGDPRSWEPYFDLGVARFAKLPRESASAFLVASQLDPSRAEPLFGRWATALMFLKLEDLARYFRYDGAVLRRPDIVVADSLRALALARNPFVHRGLEIHVYDRFPGDFSDRRDVRAWIAYSNGEFKRAIDLHSRSIDQNIKDAVFRRYDRALAYVASGNLAAALEDLQVLLTALRREDQQAAELVRYQSKHAILYMIGRIHLEMRKYDAARTAFGEALVEDAGYAYAHLGMAWVSRALRQNDRAAEEFAFAIDLAPNDGYLRYQHALALFDLQRFEGTGRELEKAMELEPRWAAPVAFLGRLRERQGRLDEAFTHYARYVEMSPGSDATAKTLKMRIDLRPKRAP